MSLGPEGKRGIWIERSSNLKEFVVAASFDQSCSACVPVEPGDIITWKNYTKTLPGSNR